jgi:hypothetical protein
MDDDELMSWLRRVCAQVDRVPAVVVDGGRAAFLTRRMDEELAELLLDSSLPGGQVRGDQEDVRLLSFEWADVSLEIQLEYVDDQVSLRGLVTGTSGAIGLELDGELRDLPIDTAGTFGTQLPRGAARFRLRTDDGTRVATSWVLL